MGSMWQRLDQAEAALIADTPWLPDRPPNRTVAAVTTAGQGGGLWLLLCLIEALRSGGDRRAARQAALAVLGAMGLSHLVKRVAPQRKRPERPGGPARRTLSASPDSSSFPSAHAATAAAFSIVAVAHRPRSVFLVAPLAVTAIYGRLRTRVHWPTDLVAGILIGLASARVTTARHRQVNGRN
jgi:membrane-associated phospholipid phosphatase